MASTAGSQVDRSQLRSALKSAANSRFNLTGSATSLKVNFDGSPTVVDPANRKSVSESKPTPSVLSTTTLAPPHNLNPITSVDNVDNSSLFLQDVKPVSRPISAASTSPRASLKLRPVSANAYHKQVKLSGFEFRRNPVIEQLAEQLIETRRQETEHLNRLFLLRLTNPWSSIKNSEVLFTDQAWAQIHHDFSSHHHHPTPPSSRPRTAPNKRSSPRPHTAPAAPPTPSRRDKYFDKLATPRPKHVNDPLPPEIPTPHTRPGPPDLARLEKLAQPRQVHPPYVSPVVYPGCSDEQRRKPVKVRQMDPVVLARLTRPKLIVNPEDVEPLHVPQVVRSKMGKKLMKGVKSKLVSSNTGVGGSVPYIVGDMDGQNSQESVEGEAGKGEVGIGRFTVGSRGGRGASTATSHHPSVVDPSRSTAGLGLGLVKNEAKSQVFVDLYDQVGGYSHANLLNEEGVPSSQNIYFSQSPTINQIEKQESILSIQRASVGANMEIVLQRPSVNETKIVVPQNETQQELQPDSTSKPVDLANSQDQIPLPPNSISHQGSIILTTDDYQENVLMSSDPNVAIVETPVPGSGSEPKLVPDHQLSKKSSMVDDERAWDLRASTIQPDYGASTRASVSQGIREDIPPDSLLRRSVSFTGSFSSITEEKEEGNEVPAVAVEGDSEAAISEWKPIGAGLSGIEGHSANISVVGSQNPSVRGSSLHGSNNGSVVGTDSGLADESENRETGASTVADNVAGNSASDITDFAPEKQVDNVDETPPQAIEEYQIPASKPHSVRGSIASLIRPSSSKGSRSGSIRESISKSIHESAARISGALRLSGSRKSLKGVSVEENIGQVYDEIPSSVVADDIAEDQNMPDFKEVNHNGEAAMDEAVFDDFEEPREYDNIPNDFEEAIPDTSVDNEKFEDPVFEDSVPTEDYNDPIEDEILNDVVNIPDSFEEDQIQDEINTNIEAAYDAVEDEIADEAPVSRKASNTSSRKASIIDDFSDSTVKSQSATELRDSILDETADSKPPKSISESKDLLSLTAADATAQEQEAAIALQATFRGFQARKKIGKGKSLDQLKASSKKMITSGSSNALDSQPTNGKGKEKSVSEDLLSMTAEGASPEEQKAATTVQAAFRGHLSREKLKSSKDGLNQSQSLSKLKSLKKEELNGSKSSGLTSKHKSNKSLRGSQDLVKSTEDEAATAVQAAFRGYQVRKSLEQLKASREQIHGSGILGEKKSQENLDSKTTEEMSQKPVKSSSKSGSQDLLALTHEDATAEEQKGAIALQATFRGYQTRKLMSMQAGTTIHGKEKHDKRQEPVSQDPKDIEWWEKNGYRGF
ncbi:UNVERIFIED_CONTAM: hypothetical protein HDU68_004521 [Siphonaria sp. JEL0065]|nr:hypothetical protein HDU68_004521 [Siphonaria sp. JEL0065]